MPQVRSAVTTDHQTASIAQYSAALEGATRARVDPVRVHLDSAIQSLESLAFDLPPPRLRPSIFLTVPPPEPGGSSTKDGAAGDGGKAPPREPRCPRDLLRKVGQRAACLVVCTALLVWVIVWLSLGLVASEPWPFHD